ncbi:family 20 glycosylhydrolase [Paenibacillus sp. KQZ6P-2]|uniref:beta-N-acetylhexosaminidase n=1 Tax=Paenibacillus mangrovi TaxID=2931978 RepID=A0A9X1WQJ1_9BACL|nr:family 20 glycosylhydrolase [Paenibacillus mangrovi]MCJ8011495.1 family 20 glycosylhydrolase [Paenibacillus mangrovi]
MKRSKNKTVSMTLVVMLLLQMLIISPNHAKAAANPPNTPSILPKPASYTMGTGQFILTDSTSIYVAGNTAEETDELDKIGQMLAKKLNVPTGFHINVIKSANPQAGSIYLTTIGGTSSQGNEGYDLSTTTDRVTLTAYTPEGVFRGNQTLIQLLPADIEKSTVTSGVQWVIPSSTISDKPAYSYRGLMFDVVRHFFTVDQVKRQIDLASQYKINKIHLHLSDDQGWRIEIKSRPDLTRIGSTTQVGGGPGGYYTQDQFKDIVNYAAERYIEVIPEIEMPGHTNAALASYGELNPDGQRKPMRTDTEVGYSTLMAHSEVTYAFVDDVIKELAAISPSPYIHIGGDESYTTSASDYDYFIGRVTGIVNKYGKKVVGWDPSDNSSGTASDSILQNWHCTSTTGTSAIAKGMKMIVSPANAYLDMKYYTDTPIGLSWRGYINTNKAYSWDPTGCVSGASIYGTESALWAETIDTQDKMDYLLYPRLIANAEVGWTTKSNRNWDDFKARLKDHGLRMKNKGIKYFEDPIVWEPPVVPIHSEWKMDEGTGTTVKDSSGYLNGALVGGATWTTGKYGNAVSFDGSSGYINLGGQEIKGPDWTLGVWVNGQSSTTRTEALISGSSSAIKINQWNKTGKVGFTVYGVEDYVFNYSIPSNQWTHLAFVGTSSGTSLYVNGVLKETNPNTMNCPMTSVGVEGQPGTGTKTSFFKGSLDELKIFNRALSASEIAALTQVDWNVPPVTVAKLDGTKFGEWYQTPVTVTLSSTDDSSGVAKTEYKLSENGEFALYTGPFTLTDGIYTITFRSVDQEGNTEADQMLQVKADSTAPSAALTANGTLLNDGTQFENDQTVTLEVDAEDNLSGVDGISILLDDEAYAAGTDMDLTGQLGSHSVTVTVTDKAGNEHKELYTFNVTTSVHAMNQLLIRYETSGELTGPVLVQLENSLKQAEDQLNKGSIEKAAKHMNDFVKHLMNRTDKDQVPDHVALVLKESANQLIALWSK